MAFLDAEKNFSTLHFSFDKGDSNDYNKYRTTEKCNPVIKEKRMPKQKEVKPKVKKVTVLVPEGLYLEARIKALRESLTVSGLITRLLAAYLKGKGQ